MNTISYKENGKGYILTTDIIKSLYSDYLRNAADQLNPYASPLLAKDLSGLPPAFVITAEFDPLRDEGEAYAVRLKEAGVVAAYTRYEGMIHGFINMGKVVDRALDAIKDAEIELNRIFQRTSNIDATIWDSYR